MSSRSLQALDVAFQRFAPGPGPGAGDRVGGHDDRRVGRGRRDVAVVAADGVEHGFGLVELAAELHADRRVAAFLVVVHGLADVVQQAGAAGEGAVEAAARRRSSAQRNATSMECRSTFCP